MYIHHSQRSINSFGYPNYLNQHHSICQRLTHPLSPSLFRTKERTILRGLDKADQIQKTRRGRHCRHPGSQAALPAMRTLWALPALPALLFPGHLHNEASRRRLGLFTRVPATTTDSLLLQLNLAHTRCMWVCVCLYTWGRRRINGEPCETTREGGS